ncbi:MAG TPA: N-acetylmuramic acid 6-phosphate etherase [Jatrophihabitantaceae bacterium]|nr:N-acetylmuramic acid 6-phosphate etherase [Jatrophihabitantaceae bacterium]
MTQRPQLDALPAEDVVDLLLAGEERVVPAVRERSREIARAAQLIADRMRAGGRLLFAGAGTSGRIAATEASELPGTFGLPEATIRGCLAGGGSGVAGLGRDADEDDIGEAVHDAEDLAIVDSDTLIAVAASGSTPYTCAVADAASKAGASIIAVVNVPESPLAKMADIAIEIPTGSEVLRDSTRLNAGTSQKITLNVLTTTAMARLGRIHGDLMVDVDPANAKLRERAAGIVAEIAGCPLDTARTALKACGGNTRAAVLQVVTGASPWQAIGLSDHARTLREALAEAAKIQEL